jgi:endonuclease YncB( thermonuclease family)
MTDNKNYNISVPFFTLNNIKTKARLIDVYDGDTVTCIFPIFGNNYYKFNLRLMGIDTAELKSHEISQKQKALEARHLILKSCSETYNLNMDCRRNDIQNYLEENETFVWIECFDFDKYGRVLANVYNYKDKELNDISLCELLLNSKLAYAYDGGKKIKN